MLWLPDARRVVHDRGLTFTDAGEPKGVLHTTETSVRPSYAGWTVNPHATVVPVAGVRVDVDQHVPFSHASFALRNLAGGVQTGRDRAYQLELVGTCNRGGPGYYWPAADDAVLLSLWDKVIRPMSDGLGIPRRCLPFQAYPSSYGDRRPDGRTNMVRLSGPEWDAYTGWCGHQHVPENIHGDPGAFPWDRMLTLAGARPDPAPAHPVTPDAIVAPRFPLPAGYYFGPKEGPRESVSGYYSHAEDLRRWQRRMIVRGWPLTASGRYDDATRRTATAFRAEKRLGRGGPIGPRTWRAAWEAPVTR